MIIIIIIIIMMMMMIYCRVTEALHLQYLHYKSNLRKKH